MSRNSGNLFRIKAEIDANAYETPEKIDATAGRMIDAGVFDYDGQPDDGDRGRGAWLALNWPLVLLYVVAALVLGAMGMIGILSAIGD